MANIISQASNDEELNFLELFSFLSRHWLKFTSIALLGAVLGVSLHYLYPKSKAEGLLYVADKDSSTLTGALSQFSSLGSGFKTTSAADKYVLYFASDEFLLGLAQRVLANPAFASVSDLYNKKFEKYKTEKVEIGQNPAERVIWFAMELHEILSTVKADSNTIKFELKSYPDEFVASVVNEGMSWAIQYSTEKDKLELDLAKRYLGEKKAEVENQIVAFALQQRNIKSKNTLGGAMSTTGFYDSGIGTLQEALDTTRTEIAQNKKMLERVQLDPNNNSISQQSITNELQARIQILQSKRDSIKEILNAKLGDKTNLIDSMNSVEMITRNIESQSALLGNLQEQILRIDLLTMTINTRFEVLSRPSLDTVKPRLPRVLAGALGFVLFFMVSFLVSFLLEQQNPMILNAKSIADFGAPCFGLIPVIKGISEKGVTDTSQRLVPSEEYLHPVLKAIFSIRRAVVNHFEAKNLPSARVISVVSAYSGSGKTMLSSTLGWALAKIGKKVLMIDFDAYNPQLSKRFRVDKKAGLFDLLEQNSDKIGSAELLQSINIIKDVDLQDNFFALSCGNTASISLNSALGQRFEALIDKLKVRYDYIIIDTPPQLETFESTPALKVSDLIMVVAVYGQTSVRNILNVLNVFPSAELKKIAFVINRSKISDVSSFSPFAGKNSPYYNRKPQGSLQKKDKKYFEDAA